MFICPDRFLLFKAISWSVGERMDRLESSAFPVPFIETGHMLVDYRS